VRAEIIDGQADKIRWLQENAPKKQRSKLGSIFGRRLNNRCVVAMVGDGINDAPVRANVVDVALGEIKLLPRRWLLLMWLSPSDREATSLSRVLHLCSSRQTSTGF